MHSVRGRTGNRGENLLDLDALPLDIGKVENRDIARNTRHSLRRRLSNDDDGMAGLLTSNLVKLLQKVGQHGGLDDDG